MKELGTIKYIKPSSETRFMVMNGELIECRIDKVVFSVRHYENGEPYVKADAYHIVNDSDLDLLVSYDEKFYQDVCKFKNDVCIQAESYNAWNLLTSVVRRGGIGHRAIWYWSDAQATKYEPTDHIKRFALLDDFNGELIEGFVPDKIYYHKDEVYAWNDIPCVDVNGEKYVKEGYLKRLIFNDEQKALMEEFKTLTEKMKNAKIKFTYYNGDVLAMNGEHIKTFEYEDYDGQLPLLVQNDFMQDHSLHINADSWDDIFIEFNEQN